MANFLKYAAAAGAGYALHAYLKNKEESKVYRPTTLNEDTLSQKIAATVSGHLVDKISSFVYDKASTPRSRYARTYPGDK